MVLFRNLSQEVRSIYSKVAKGEQRTHTCNALGQATIERPPASRNAPEDMKLMLSLRLNTGLVLLELLPQSSCLPIGQRTALTMAQSNVPLF